MNTGTKTTDSKSRNLDTPALWLATGARGPEKRKTQGLELVPEDSRNSKNCCQNSTYRLITVRNGDLPGFLLMEHTATLR
jgi:hypothetical protein